MTEPFKNLDLAPYSQQDDTDNLKNYIFVNFLMS